MNNPIRDVLNAGVAPAMNGSPTAAIAGASTGGTVAAPSGAGTSVGRVQIGIAAAFVLSIAVLVLLNRAGFKFSVTVGG